MRKLTVIFVAILLVQSLAYGQNDTIYVYGPGGPYPAINEAATVFSEKNKVVVKVVKGPVSKWEQAAKINADIIYSGSEFMMSNFSKKFDILEKESITPLYLRNSGLLVRPGNPKNITSFSDILKPGIRVMVVNGAGLTGMWEDMIGRTKDIDSLKMLRNNISFFAEDSGAAKAEWMENESIDVWITWNIWQIANPTLADFIPVEEKFTIYRDCGIALTTNSLNNKTAVDFYNFLKSEEAKPIFKKWGWLTE